MTAEVRVETTDSIIESLMTEGYIVTRRQLSNWHRRGLIPTPNRRALGRGKGSVSEYPPGTISQTKAIVSHLSSPGKHSLKETGAWLWIQEYPVPDAFFREALINAADWFRAASAKLCDPVLLDAVDCSNDPGPFGELLSALNAANPEGKLFVGDLVAAMASITRQASIIDATDREIFSSIVSPIDAFFGNPTPIIQVLRLMVMAVSSIPVQVDTALKLSGSQLRHLWMAGQAMLTLIQSMLQIAVDQTSGPQQDIAVAVNALFSQLLTNIQFQCVVMLLAASATTLLPHNGPTSLN